MSHTKHDHGATIGGALIIGIILACVVSSARGAEIHTAQRVGVQSSQTQFVVMQYLNVQTVTCKTYLAHADFQGYGSIEGEQCSTTGTINAIDGTQGNVTVSFTFTDGTTIDLLTCRVDSEVLSPSFNSLSVDCL